MGLRDDPQLPKIGPEVSQPLWRFKCLGCGASLEVTPERLLVTVKQTIARGEHHLRLD
jgi:hypothetical protein